VSGTPHARRPRRFAHISGDGAGDCPSWMAHLHDAADSDLESLLRGELPDDPDALGAVADVVMGLRVSALAEPLPPMGDQLRIQLAAAAPRTAAARRLKLRAGARAISGAAAAATLVALVGAGAATSRLPTTLQNAVSAAADLIGVDVPRADDQADAAAGTAFDGALTPGGSTPAEPGTPGDREPAIPALPPDDAGAPPGARSGTDASDRSRERPDDPRVSPDPATVPDEPPPAPPSAPPHAPPLGNSRTGPPEPSDERSRDRPEDEPAADGEEIDESSVEEDAAPTTTDED